MAHSIHRLTIGSRSHPVVARFRETRDGRDERSLYVEGRRLLEELLTTSLSIQEAVMTPAAAADPRTLPLLTAWRERNVPVYYVTPTVMEFLSDLEAPPGLVARTDRPVPVNWTTQAWGPSPLLVLLDGLQSPANVGAVLRVAEAAGVSGLGILPGTADPLSPKALRASAGSTFRVPLFRATDLSPLLQTFPAPPTILAADPAGSKTFAECDWRRPCLLLLGGEARGINPQVLQNQTVERIRIPMAGRVESLNVAVAAGILLMEARRQRTAHDGKPLNA